MKKICITKAGEGEHFQVIADVVTLKAFGEATSGKLLLLENIVPAGGGPPTLHRHHYAEIFYILNGRFEITTLEAESDDAEAWLCTVIATQGDTVAIPSLAWHNFKNVGETAGKFLAIHSPSGMEQFAREIGTPIADPIHASVPAGPPSDEERQRMMGIITKYMEVLPMDKTPR
jgi:mannose-6-phosphate isomerase-like protein (cupin superfamily)